MLNECRCRCRIEHILRLTHSQQESTVCLVSVAPLHPNIGNWVKECSDAQATSAVERFLTRQEFAVLQNPPHSYALFCKLCSMSACSGEGAVLHLLCTFNGTHMESAHRLTWLQGKPPNAISLPIDLRAYSTVHPWPSRCC